MKTVIKRSLGILTIILLYSGLVWSMTYCANESFNFIEVLKLSGAVIGLVGVLVGIVYFLGWCFKSKE